MQPRLRTFRYLIFSLCFLLSPFAKAQLTCPPNVDLEWGSTTNWNFYVGYATGTAALPSLSSSAPVSWRHAITNGGGTDYYGGFPIVCPGGGNYSLKLGNDYTGGEVDQARYVVSVPSGVNNYSLIYRYAVVFEDPQHNYYEQPYFRVRAFNQATGALINCSYYYYVSQSGLPGFSISGNAWSVYYKPWTTASLNLSGQAGQNVVVEFTAADCSLGGHMGYGYVDLTCGLFAINNTNCSGAATSALSAPFGFRKYEWYNSSYTTLIDTAQNITVPATSAATVYHVVLTPYPGYGCPDTLTTSVFSASLAVSAGPDTSVCNSANVPLHAAATGNGAPYVYSWLPSSGLSCANCANPLASPSATTNYIVTVSDANGCIRSDTVNVKARLAVTASGHFPACGNTGLATVVATRGTPPYSYTWITSPMQTAATATGLPAGSCTVSVTDSKGCNAMGTVSLVKPPAFTASISASANVACFGAATGSATVTAVNGALPLNYTWSGMPLLTGNAAVNLTAGNYKVIATDADGCKDSAVALITQPLSALTASITGVQPFCNGWANGAALTVAAGGTAPYTYYWNTAPAQTTANASGLGAGNYAVTVKDSRNCQVTAGIALAQPSALTASLAAVSPVSCAGGTSGSAIVSASGARPPYTYSWNTIPAQATAAAVNLSAGNYTITVADSMGCTKTLTAVITAPSPLNASLTKTDVSCHGGNNGSAAVTATGGTAPYAYSWNTSPAQMVPAVVGLSAGAYVVTITDAKGCTTTAPVNITQPAALSVSATKTDILCNGGTTGAATAVVAGGTAPYNYAWSTSPLKTAAAATGLSAGSYTVSVTDAKGCLANAMVTLTQPPALNPAIAKTDVSCYGGSNGSAGVFVTGGTAPYIYSWNTIPAQTGAAATGLLTGAYTVAITDANGCVANDSITVDQPLQIAGSVTAPALACYGASNGVVSVTVSGGVAPYAYAWNTTPAQTGAAATALPAGSYSVSVSDAHGCLLTLNAVIGQPPGLVVTASVTDALCYGSNGSATLLPAGGTPPYSYSWNTAPAISTGSTGPLPAGSYTATVTDAAGCTLSVPAIIRQPEQLSLVAAVRNQPCKWGNEGSLNVAATGGKAPYAYAWNTLPVQTGPAAVGLRSGAYFVAVSDAAGCRDTARIVLQSRPIHITADSSRTICAGKSIPLHATGGVSYRWSPPDGLSCLACADPVARPGATSVYVVAGTDTAGCTDTARVLVQVLPHPKVSAGPDIDICAGGTAALQATGGIDYQWFPATFLDDAASAHPVAGPLPATQTFRVAITANECFTDTMTQTVRVHPLPAVSLGPDLRGITGAVIPLDVHTTGAGSISWAPSDGLSCADCFTPSVTLGGNATYIATVHNDWGCTASDTLAVSAGCDEAAFFMANTFTPNGDGQNDRFFPQGRGVSRVARFMIYDRWGETVFAVENLDVNAPDKGWDGSYRGHPLKPDVYLYVVEARCADGSPVVVRGDVALIR